MNIDDGYCKLLLSWTIVYQPVIQTRSDLDASGCQAFLVHKMYAGNGTFSTFSMKRFDRLFNHSYVDLPDRDNTL